MVPREPLAVRPVDKLVVGYLVLVTGVMVIRGGISQPIYWSLLLMHALVVVLVYLGSRLQADQRWGRAFYTAYPLLITPALYSELGILAVQHDVPATFARDALVQGWESTVFSAQVSYEWIRHAPSVFWSGVLHLAYFAYYPIVTLGPLLLLLRNEEDRARSVVLATMIAFIACYVVFLLFPVAGPNYAFPHPTGPVRDVWSARLVYWVLAHGSAFGTAFPSSHVAATVAATIALWYQFRELAIAFFVPVLLMIVGTVYCQMHYGVDALTGLAVGAGAGWLGLRISNKQ